MSDAAARHQWRAAAFDEVGTIARLVAHHERTWPGDSAWAEDARVKWRRWALELEARLVNAMAAALAGPRQAGGADDGQDGE